MLDTIITILLIIAFFKGYSRGIVIAIFSFIATIMGMLIAIKFHMAIGNYLISQGVSSKWGSLAGFFLILFSIAMGIRWFAVKVHKIMEKTILGFANKLAGALLFVLLYCTVISLVLFYTEKIGLLPQEWTSSSHLYPIIQSLAPFVMNTIGMIIPYFKTAISDINVFLDNINKVSTQ